MKKKYLYIFLLLQIIILAQQKTPNYSELFNNNPAEILRRWEKDFQNSNDPIEKVDILMEVSETYRIQGDYKNMILFINRANDEAKSIDNPIVQYDIASNLAYDYFLIDMLTKSEELTFKQLNSLYKADISDQNKKHLLILDAYSQLGSIKKKQKKYAQAISYYKQGLQELLKTKNLDTYQFSERTGSLNNNISATFLDQNNIDSAQVYTEKVANITHLDTLVPRLYGISQMSLGEIAYRKNNLKDANFYLKKALPIFEKDKYSDKLLKLYSLLTKLYILQNKPKEALQYKEKETLQRANLENTKVTAIDLTINKIEKYRLEIEKTHKTYKYIYICIGSIIAITFLFYSLYQKKKNKKEKILYQKIIHKLERELKEDITNRFQNEIKKTEKTFKENSLSEGVEEDLLRKLMKFENLTKFTNPNLSLSMLATQLNTNTNYLSEVINIHKGKNFNAYINELRINYICNKIINEPEYCNYKISYLAQISGFSSHSVFTKVFKNVTGISPSVFINQSRGK
ncbi:helix-turn-helix transcriptional regulator [Elizabethkingia anophelis]|nr:helix-turn-helix transcriptional regulator [Elizabethkingia anophelis]MCT4152791.1 helix-turn-helix transcriptional regulator [Elizabethkingia anophelis]MCT4316718.1 helix-turn-helix transcriptional regulator [Elizabethkingia anophelis]